jgi:hypothetical protein
LVAIGGLGWLGTSKSSSCSEKAESGTAINSLSKESIELVVIIEQTTSLK